mmetsp:Transcript_76354/g.154977  ORF Transcript_76354/g.154977 Transcript_76354/m.154977 type:complete len:97 (+) Transcript_76354:1-291(+)
MNLGSSRGVRSSLVKLGSGTSNTIYWGSGWENNNNNNKQSSLAVPMGRKAGLSGSAPLGPGGRTAPPDDPIVPLNRASGSRVSRVLEGSMDAAAMQ